MKRILFVIFILIACVTQVFATETQKATIEKVDLSFEQAYELMLENNNSLKAYNEAIKQMEYEKKSALGEFAPKVGMNATYMHFSDDMTINSSGSIRGMPFQANTLIQEKNLFAFGGGAVWNIFTGGKLLSNHAAARAKLEASNAKYKEVKDSLTIELVKRYYGLKFAKDVLEVRKLVQNGLSQHLKEAKSLEKEGMIAKSERLHAQVAYSNAQRDYKAALSDVAIAEEGLKALIKADDVNLRDVYIEPNSLLFISEKQLDLKTIKENLTNNNPQLKQLKAKKKALDAKYHAKAGEYMPTVSLVAYGIPVQSHLTDAVPRAGVGGMANMLLFDGFSRYNNLRAADCERKMVEYQIKDAQYNLESLAVKQYEEISKYKERYVSSNSAIENSKEALRMANLSFKEGLGTSLQVTDAQMMDAKVKIERLKALYDYDVALAELMKTNGNTNEFLMFIQNSKQEQY